MVKRVDVTASISVDVKDHELLKAAGFRPIVRWVEERSDVALKTLDAVVAAERAVAKGIMKKGTKR
jgi:hypothetical protein